MTVLDASALLVWLRRDPGSPRVTEALRAGAHVSALSLSEVQAVFARRGALETARAALDRVPMAVHDFGRDAAHAAAEIASRSPDLSLETRAALALASRLHLPLLTGHREDGAPEFMVPVVIRVS